MFPENNIQNIKVNVTQHAYRRARQRCGWNAAALERMSKKAFESGLKTLNTKGRLKKYVDHLQSECKSANNIRLYGENVFLFSDHVLITVWQLPAELRPLAKVIKLKLYSAKAS